MSSRGARPGTAAARARVAEDHERGRAPLPALADVRARGLLADRVKVLVADEPGQLAVALTAWRRHLEPRRLALADRPDLGSEDLEDVHAAGVRARASGHVLRLSRARGRAAAAAPPGAGGDRVPA